VRSDDPSTMFIPPASSSSSVGWRTGVIESWDELTGLNSVRVEGQSLPNLRVLSTGLVTPFQIGDVVGIEVIGTQYFILGRIRAPGAGAAERIASSRIQVQNNNVPPQAFGDLPNHGPEVTMFIGSARRVLVVHSCEMGVNQSSGYQGVQVTGASNIAVETAITDAFLAFVGSGANIFQSVTATTVVTAANGLKQGVNTFTCKYKVTVSGTGTGVDFNNRVLTVIPF
jgi:hypothetical protein